MKFFAVFILSFSVSFMSQAFSTGQPFVRINSAQQKFEVAFRSYKNDQNKVVKLMGMVHIAEQSFYDKVNSLNFSKTVIYELAGQKWRDIQAEKLIFKSYGPGYYECCLALLNSMYRIAKHHGLACQLTGVNYDLAAKLIHADFITENPTPSKIQLDLFIAQQYENLLEEGEQREKDLDAITAVILNKASLCIPELSVFAIELVKLEECSENKARFITARNEIVERKLRDVLSLHDEVLINYGVYHLPDLEKFLLQEGFAPMQDGEEWYTLFAL